MCICFFCLGKFWFIKSCARFKWATNLVILLLKQKKNQSSLLEHRTFCCWTSYQLVYNFYPPPLALIHSFKTRKNKTCCLWKKPHFSLHRYVTYIIYVLKIDFFRFGFMQNNIRNPRSAEEGKTNENGTVKTWGFDIWLFECLIYSEPTHLQNNLT